MSAQFDYWLAIRENERNEAHAVCEDNRLAFGFPLPAAIVQKYRLKFESFCTTNKTKTGGIVVFTDFFIKSELFDTLLIKMVQRTPTTKDSVFFTCWTYCDSKQKRTWYEEMYNDISFDCSLQSQDPVNLALPLYFYSLEMEEFRKLSTTERKESMYPACFHQDGKVIFEWLQKLIGSFTSLT